MNINSYWQDKMEGCTIIKNKLGKQWPRGKTHRSRLGEPRSCLLWFSEQRLLNAEYWHSKSVGLKDLDCMYGSREQEMCASPPDVTIWEDTVVIGVTRLCMALYRFQSSWWGWLYIWKTNKSIKNSLQTGEFLALFLDYSDKIVLDGAHFGRARDVLWYKGFDCVLRHTGRL